MSDSVPGFLAVVREPGTPAVPDLKTALGLLGLAGATVSETPRLALATWGLGPARPSPGHPLVLSGTNWSNEGHVPSDTLLSEWLASGDQAGLGSMLPPFAALGATDKGFVLASDHMGFRQLFRSQGSGWLGLSTSARALAALRETTFDSAALQMQSLLGWQLEQRTLYEGVAKLEPGASVRVTDNVEWSVVDTPETESLTLDEATRRATRLLRDFLERYLDSHPDPTLQLTGGQDSRLVLSAIPPGRRRGLKVLTMGSPGTPDVDVAARLAARYGMIHSVQGLEGLTRLSPAECFARACAAAVRLDGMADPIAKAATLWAEERFEQGPRLAGLGGEIARGFYYLGRVRRTPVTRARSERLAAWRMFANETVEAAALDPRFVAAARPASLEAVHRILASAEPDDWYRATDELYFRHRMQRWAGLSESAVCFDRQIANPMLDGGFIAIARALDPQDKAGAVFLARVQVELDAELAAIPLDNRPPPAQLARPGLAGWARQQRSTGMRLVRKLRQRAARGTLPPAGGAALASGIVRHLQSAPETLDPLRGLGVFAESWLDELASGRVTAQPATLAFVVNLLAASPPRRQPASAAAQAPVTA